MADPVRPELRSVTSQPDQLGGVGQPHSSNQTGLSSQSGVAFANAVAKPSEDDSHAAEGLKELQRALAYEDTFNCIQCGYCLPVCPTYETMGTETHSPRGRINLVKMTAEGKLTDLNLLADSIDKCLGCRACETACPTGVKYGHILESAKEVLAQRQPHSLPAKVGRNVLFRGLFPNKRLMNSLAGSLWIYQRSGLESVVNKLKLTRILPKSVAAFATLLPRQTSPFSRLRRPSSFHPPQGKPRFRVAFFTGCIMDAVFERINRLSMKLLAAGGCEVVAIPGETCCGALHAHSGERSTSKELAKRNIAAIERLAASGTIDFVVNNAGGCGAMLSEYAHLFSDEPEWQRRASLFAAVSKDISEVLVQLELPFKRSEQQVETVTYQRSCHMTHVQKVSTPPLELIRSIPGIRLEEMVDKDKCCGSAGIYNVVHYDESMDILDLKMKSAAGTSAATIVTTNPGCLLQMQLGIQREGLENRMRAVHLVELLAEACGLEPSPHLVAEKPKVGN